MKRDIQGAVLLFIGLITLRLALTGAYKQYLRPQMGVLLFVAAAVLLVFGASLLLPLLRRDHPDDDADDPGDAALGAYRGAHDAPEEDTVHPGDGHGHAHDRGPRIAWLLLLPFAVLILVTPQPLGAFAAQRAATQSKVTAEQPETDRADTSNADSLYPPLADPTDGAVEMSLLDFNDRGWWDESRPLLDKTVRLTGFVTPASDSNSGDFLLTRFVVSCCAADGFPIYVAVEDFPGAPPAADTWLEIEGEWIPHTGEPDAVSPDPARIRVDDWREIDQPAEPYEY